MPRSEKVQKVVRELIEESELPHTLIARDTNLSRAAVVAWVSGTRTPQPESIAQLADGLEKRANRLQYIAFRLRSLLEEGSE